jgi:hypothetical protein
VGNKNDCERKVLKSDVEILANSVKFFYLFHQFINKNLKLKVWNDYVGMQR